MNDLFYAALEALLLVVALSLDAFVASFAYGAQRIRIPYSSAAIISVICTSGGITAAAFPAAELDQRAVLCNPFFAGACKTL